MRIFLCFSLLCAAPLHAADWPQWRGPAQNGSTTETNLPSTLDVQKNLAWSVDLPGASAGTPIILGDKIFLSALERKTKNLLALCLDRKTGKEVWKREVAVGFTSNSRNDLAAPSPATDDKRAIFLYGSGDVAAFDLSGKPLWQRNLQKDFGEFNVQFLYGATGLLHEGKYFVPVIHRSDESYLLALDAATGKDVWRAMRPSDARDESKEAYTTPIAITRDGKTEIVVLGGDAVTGHELQSGKELWRIGGWNPNKVQHWRIVPSPVLMNDLIVICPPKNGAVFSFKPGATEWAWKNEGLTSDVCTPLLMNGKLYVLDGDKKRLSCADPATGKVQWTHELGGHAVFRGSPTGADGKIYCMNESGEVWVLSATEPKTLHQSTLEGARARSTIIASGGAVFVRTADKMFCFKN